MNKLILSTVTLLLSLLLLQNCKNPLEGIDVTLQSTTSTHFGLIEISDTTTLDIGQENLTVEILGDDTEYLYNEAGGKEFQATNGLLSFTVDPDYTFAKPLTFTVLVTGDNYLEKQVPVTVTMDDTVSYTKVEMERLEDVTGGEEVVEDNFDLSSGARMNSTAFFSSSRSFWNNSSLSVDVKVPASSAYRDFYNNNYNASSMYIGLGAYDYESYNYRGYSYKMHIPALIRNLQGDLENDQGIYMSQFVYLYMYANSNGYKRVYSTSESFTVTTTLNPSTINQETGSTIKAGDNIKVFRMGNTNNYFDWYVREVEDNATIQERSDGSLYITFNSNYSSYFWIGYKKQVCKAYNYSTTPVTYRSRYNNREYRYYPAQRNENFGSIKFSTSNSYNNSHIVGARVTMTYPDGTKQYVYNTWGFRLYNNSRIRPWFSVGEASMQLEIYERYNPNNVYYTSSKFDLCNGDVTFDVESILSKLPNYQTVTIDYQGKCGSTVIKPTVPLWVEHSNSSGRRYYQYYYVRNGKVTLYSMEVGKTYPFHTVYNNKWYTEDVTIESTLMENDNYEVPQRFCDMIN
ncbi:hypothetical protein [Flammeovirga kamogawensis]|uniref:Cadherin domain-containing protein n=1 Tax=Flammeovirga kamogawensis TaxID=373891 RepID=A0ABX8H1W2_9BACT|nr:hypothetical protein [Flammeovirga kamogawensis]MBB6462648.1 hypothetical protein [Flammeovirga kamogawensis]QWG09608.1 hypothetical protein KM029_23680 [Flammeovirga kamogawensis]TRX65122.1 hypothetical protein EO216_21580 [Flammeovirga kamogawensis]